MNALEMYPKTQYTQLSFELMIDGSVLDLARTQEEAIDWCKMMRESGEFSKSTNFSFNPILLDEDNGDLVTEENVRIYLKPQFDDVFKRQFGWNH